MKLEHGKMESFSLKNPCSQESVTQELAIWRWLQVKFPKLFVKFLSLDISLYLWEEMMGIVLLFNQHSTIDVGFFFKYYFSFFYLFAKLVCEMYCIPKNLNSLPVESITLFFVDFFGSFGNASDCFNWHSKQKPVRKQRRLSTRVFFFQFCGFVDWWSSTRGLSQIWNFGNPATFWWHARTLVTYYVWIVPMTPQHLMLYKNSIFDLFYMLKISHYSHKGNDCRCDFVIDNLWMITRDW